MIPQLLAHFWGDYIFQTHLQAINKRKSFRFAAMHALTYSVPFLFLTRSGIALAIICLSHLFIDYYGLARYVVTLKNILGDTEHAIDYMTPTGYPESTPVWLSTWLLIIADNILHVTINYFALRFF